MQSHWNGRSRSTTGSMVVLSVCIVACVMVPILILICQYGPYFVFCGRAQNVIEAAALVAANDFSRVVIKDPNFGYVSLSNHSAIGRGTCAQDGEPLPVISINTLIGTLRQNALVADALQNQTMSGLVDEDLDSLHETIDELNTALSASASGRQASSCDIDGKVVTTSADVEAFLNRNLPQGLKLESVRLTLGWLDGGSETTIEIPQPADSQIKTDDKTQGTYVAFRNIPVGARGFSFAGLGSQSHLVSQKLFREADGKHSCSVVRLDCTVVSLDGSHRSSRYCACAQSCCAPDQSSKGAMIVRFPQSPVSGVLSWSELLGNGNFQDNKLTNYDTVNGDFPFDEHAYLYESQKEAQTNTSKEFASHFYYWLRNAHVRPHVESVLAMVHEPFETDANVVYIYEPTDDGKIARRVVDGRSFTRPVIADGQPTVVADTLLSTGRNAIILFRDNVARQGMDAGRHGGQPLAGYPLNSGLDSWFDQNNLTQRFPKRNNNADGLALDIEIGLSPASAAKDDLHRMRHRMASRKI